MRRSANLFKSTARAPHLVVAALAIFLTAAPVYADSVCQIAKLVAGDGAADDEFGRSVAIVGTTAIVGAPAHDDNGDNVLNAADPAQMLGTCGPCP